MEIKNVYGVCFSPTGGTKLCVNKIAGCIQNSFQEVNITDFETREKGITFTGDDIVVLGVPVYGGRIPEIKGGIIGGLKGEKTPVICVVSYGNREYDDALLELKNQAEKQGFICVAAGAFIAKHTFSELLGVNRPDEEDFNIIEKFGIEVRNKITGMGGYIPDLTIRGNMPYREFKPFPFTPEADERCNECGDCIKVCPVRAIRTEDIGKADQSRCITCFACVNACPQGARKIRISMFTEKIESLEKAFGGIRKEPELFI